MHFEQNWINKNMNIRKVPGISYESRYNVVAENNSNEMSFIDDFKFNDCDRYESQYSSNEYYAGRDYSPTSVQSSLSNGSTDDEFSVGSSPSNSPQRLPVAAKRIFKSNSPQTMLIQQGYLPPYQSNQTMQTNVYYQGLPQYTTCLILSEKDEFKHRQLPCKTFISVGTCPYRDRCDYLHDPRILCKDAKTKTRKKNVDDMTADSMFWPKLPSEIIGKRLDCYGQPLVVQPYHVPKPEKNPYLIEDSNHDAAIFSLWNHFVDFCQQCQVMSINRNSVTSVTNNPKNQFTGKMRLPIFLKLACSESVAKVNDEGLSKFISNTPILFKSAVFDNSHTNLFGLNYNGVL